MSDRPLDLGWMRIFTDVARRGSLTAAAASLRLTQAYRQLSDAEAGG